ncbi:DsbA family protein [Halobacteriales archaeon Cl-PHB]
MNRRRFLRGGLVASAGLVAGCAGNQTDGDGSPSGGVGSTPETNGSSNGSDGGVVDAAGTAGLAEEPTLGEGAAQTPGLVVAFQDPACPYCAKFHDGGFQDLRSGAIEAGKVTFVSRDIAILADWADPAARALAATFDRDPASYWALQGHVYATQDAFTTKTVLSRIREFLASETSVDAEAVVSAVEAGEYADALASDQQAAERAGISATPSFMLFRGGTYVTTITGNQSATVIESALRL